MAISIDYDPVYDTIDGIYSIEVRKSGSSEWIDVTAILMELMAFDSNIERIDWCEVYVDSLETVFEHEQDV